MPTPRRPRRDTRGRVGIPEVDDAITAFVDAADPVENRDLFTEMSVTIARLARDGADRGDLKLLNGAIRELRTSFRRFEAEADRPKASVFGSARTPVTAPSYTLARELGAALAHEGWMVISGGGPGIMTATIEGAGGSNSFAVTIRLPFEGNPASALVDDDHLVRFRYFFTRKLAFMKEASAYVILPGGFGTMDELFELLTLVQTGKEMPAPIVLLEPEGGTYWRTWVEFVQTELIDSGWVSPNDLDLVHLSSSSKDAVRYIVNFFGGYHSLRYVDGRLVVRLQREIGDAALATLNEEFGSMVASGSIERTAALPAEVEDDDVPHLPRITMDFDNRSFTRLHAMALRLADLV